MRLFLKECRRLAVSIVFLLYAGVMIFSFYKNFFGVTADEIRKAHGENQVGVNFNRPLLMKPGEDDKFFGYKAGEDDPVMIMTGTTRALIMEYKNNTFATYPFGYYKAVSLSDEDRNRVLEIICEITGLTSEQISDLPKDYFPKVTGTIISADYSEDESKDASSDEPESCDYTQKFISQVTYDHFKELMREMESIVGEKKSVYSQEMMISYFGMTEMTYEDAEEEYRQTVENDKVTGGFARLFCDYMGQITGLGPVFLILAVWLSDRKSRMNELIYVRKISSLKLILSRYAACVTMSVIPLFLLSLESLVPLAQFAVNNSLQADLTAFARYIVWWLVPSVMVSVSAGMILTLLTDTPIAAAVQFLWWFADRGCTGLSGDTKLFTLMIRHNSLTGYEVIEQDFKIICINRLIMIIISTVLVLLSVFVFEKKRTARFTPPHIQISFFTNTRKTNSREGAGQPQSSADTNPILRKHP